MKAQGAGNGSTRLSYKKGAEQDMNRRARSGTNQEGPYMPNNVWPNLRLIANGKPLKGFTKGWKLSYSQL